MRDLRRSRMVCIFDFSIAVSFTMDFTYFPSDLYPTTVTIDFTYVVNLFQDADIMREEVGELF